MNVGRQELVRLDGQQPEDRLEILLWIQKISGAIMRIHFSPPRDGMGLRMHRSRILFRWILASRTVTGHVQRRNHHAGIYIHMVMAAQLTPQPHPIASTSTFPVVLALHNATNAQPTLRSIHHLFRGMTSSKPSNVTTSVTPLMTKVGLISI